MRVYTLLVEGTEINDGGIHATYEMDGYSDRSLGDHLPINNDTIHATSGWDR